VLIVYGHCDVGGATAHLTAPCVELHLVTDIERAVPFILAPLNVTYQALASDMLSTVERLQIPVGMKSVISLFIHSELFVTDLCGVTTSAKIAPRCASFPS